ncbi:DNA-processing protein DprA [Vogesella indigofera]|uniref:DNA-processing protein DprA n=1 Tax=Vogesella indigofera TaxID=45465 RepID=UPI00234E83CF|nr:DNA-processing protein DprA [Vogesella indigofera]MDC7709667.1 DNA-processing protein DprA [Vogesella indigofera]
MSPQSLLDWATLALTPGIGPQRFLQLLQRFGDAGHACRAGHGQLRDILDGKTLAALDAGDGARAAEAALQWAEGADCHLLTLNDDDYPCQLAEAGSAPPLLFARGRRSLLAQPMLAVVGSRHATPQGADNARDFSQRLAAHGYSIVSGLAGGIDAAAHEGALPEAASTIAVIGTGIDRVYPARNRELAHRIAGHGLILSEFALGTPPLAGHFPQRNRIIAGLARGCLVVEAAPQSGSLITARLALEAGRDVMAIPGSIHNPQARGCHRLIKDGARLVESADDVLDEIGRLATAPAAGASATPATSDADAHPLLAAIGYDPVDSDTLAARLKLTAGELYAMLLELELAGHIESLDGGRYQRRSPAPSRPT